MARKIIIIVSVIAIVFTALFATAETMQVKKLAFGVHFPVSPTSKTDTGLYTGGQTWATTKTRADGMLELNGVAIIIEDVEMLEKFGFKGLEEGVYTCIVNFRLPGTGADFFAVHAADGWHFELVDAEDFTGDVQDLATRFVGGTQRTKDGKQAVALTKYDSSEYVRVISIRLADGQVAGIFVRKADLSVWFCTGYGESHQASTPTTDEDPVVDFSITGQPTQEADQDGDPSVGFSITGQPVADNTSNDNPPAENPTVDFSIGGTQPGTPSSNGDGANGPAF